ncbi:hypothetical protein B0H13DRAFT_2389627 [Mycena leptocephala]|nr:hypothetical protein B0H13DRAFT_2389627 [Mycena leptocephala]
MPRAGTAARRRAREGLPPVKPGKRGWVHGTKLLFFEGHKDAFMAATEIKETGDFYDKMSQLYLKKYGYNTDWDDDLDEDQEVADDVDRNEDEDSLTLTEEEAEEHATYFKKLRNKIGVWYKAQYGGSVEKKQKKVMFTQVFDNSRMEPPATVKPRVLHWYSRHFWNERIQDRFNARWTVVSRGRTPPAVITVRNAVTKEAWLSETEGFQQEVLAAIDKNHQIALDAYTTATSGKTPTMPEEYNLALNNAAYYLQPFADAIQERFGMNMAILMCGPIADRGGRIEVQSVHAGMSNGLVPRIWSDFDRAGFDQAQRSLIDFTHSCFSEAECRAQSLNENVTARTSEDQPDPVSRSNETAMAQTSENQLNLALLNGNGQDSPPASESTGSPPGVGVGVGSGAIGIGASDSEPAALPNGGVATNGLGLPMRNESGGPGGMAGAGGTTTTTASTPGGPTLRRPRAGRPALQSCTATEECIAAKIGQALADELAQFPQTERELLMARLRDMGEDDLDMENDFAWNRLFLRRVNEGMSAMDAITLGAAEEEEEEARAARAASGEEEGGGWWNEKINPHLSNAQNPSHATAEPQMRWVNRDVEGPVQREREGPTSTVEREEAARSPEEAPSRPEEAPRRLEEAPRRPEEASTTPTPNTPDESQGGGTPPTWQDPDMMGWPNELHKVFRAFERGKVWGGNEWETCVTRLIALEKTWKYAAKAMLSAPNGQEDERPEEIPEFMRLARKWYLPVSLSSGIGPRETEGSFSNRWWRWWGHAQPESRLGKDGEWLAPADLKSEDWSEVAKMHGRNGMLLYLGGLLWWGESAAAAAATPALLADWKLAVEDVSVVLAAAIECESTNPTVKAKETRNATKTAGGQKRKKPATSSAPDKENSPPKKRLRTRR